MALGKSKIIVFGAAVEIVNVPFATVSFATVIRA
jgi:hypothetical protein